MMFREQHESQASKLSGLLRAFWCSHKGTIKVPRITGTEEEETRK